VTAAATRTVVSPDGEALTGVRILAPFSRLPTIPLHALSIHAGRFYAERAFDPPLDAAGRPFVDIHVWASCDVPVTVYVDNVHSDIDLHAGEQIVRVNMKNYGGAFNYADWDRKIRRISFDLWPQDNYSPYPPVQDAEVVFLRLTLSGADPEPGILPHKGKAVWLSQFRPNIPRGVAVPDALRDQYLQRQRFRHVGQDYGARWISERFRTFTEHRAVSPVFAIVTAPQPTRQEREAAADLSRLLERRFGVRLPVNPAGWVPATKLANVILLGKSACLAAGRVEERELRHVGREGFAINAHQGRIAIAGADDAGTAYGMARYLEDHGLRFLAPDRIADTAAADPFLHELYVLDWPYFKTRPVPGGWMLKTSADAKRARDADAPETAMRLAEAVKRAARAGRTEVPQAVLREASRSALSRYVAARLLWDPFEDARRLVREYLEFSRADQEKP